MSFSPNHPDPDRQPRPQQGRITIRWSIRRAPASPFTAPAPAPALAGAPGTPGAAGAGDPRLNLLLTYGGWREASWADALPTLLEPMGVRSFRADTGAEATRVLRSTPIHAAVVDLRLPLDRPSALPGAAATEPAEPAAEEGGERLLEILRRLEAPPPTVVVTRDRTPRERMRELHHALRHGAYAVVLGSAADAEQMLRVLQRLVARYYQNRWPGGTLPPAPGPTPQ